MDSLPLIARVIFYVLVVLIGVLTLVIWGWQIQILRGKEMKNPDGSVDSWHEQKLFFGIATADVFLACPLSALGIVLLFVNPRLGSYLMALVSFWLLWANIMTTVTSLKFEKPAITLSWFIVFPFGALVGAAYLVWTLLYFDVTFGL